MSFRTGWYRLKHIFLHSVLHVDDSPERIALGVAVGIFVAFTPTLGVQMILAVALAAVLGANKAVTVPAVWVTNPITALPIYWTNYQVGHVLLTGGWWSPEAARSHVRLLAEQAPGLGIFGKAFWSNLWAVIVEVGGSLWLGSAIIGLVAGAIMYLVVHKAVRRYRSRRDGGLIDIGLAGSVDGRSGKRSSAA